MKKRLIALFLALALPQAVLAQDCARPGTDDCVVELARKSMEKDEKATTWYTFGFSDPDKCSKLPSPALMRMYRFSGTTPTEFANHLLSTNQRTTLDEYGSGDDFYVEVRMLGKRSSTLPFREVFTRTLAQCNKKLQNK